MPNVDACPLCGVETEAPLNHFCDRDAMLDHQRNLVERETAEAIVEWLREQAQMHGYGFMRQTPEVAIAERIADLIERGEWKASDSPSPAKEPK